MTEQSVNVTIRAIDQFSATAGRVTGSLRTMEGAAGRFGGALSHAKNQIGGLVGSLGPLAGITGILGVSAALKNSVGDAKDFAAAMELIHTQAGASQAEVQSMTDALLKLGASVGKTPEELAAGLYHIESAGIRGAQALDVLTIAAQGAEVGNADLESVTNALVAAINSGIAGTKTMGESMGVLNAIVGAGNMRMQDLTDSFSTGILSSAKAFGVSIQSVGSAIADMTNQGVPAIDAATRLRMTLSLLGAPSAKATKELKLIGLGQLDLATAMRGPDGILGAVALLKEHLDASGLSATEQAQLLSNAFGGGRSSSAILTLLGSLDKFRTIQDQVIKGTGSFGEAWAATQEQSDFAFKKFGAAFQTLQIAIGAKILPTVTDFLGKLTDFIIKNTDAISTGIESAIQFASKVGAVIGDVIGKVAGLWGAIPKELREFLVTGFVAQKASSFLFGSGPLQWLQSLVGLGARKTGIGAALGGIGVQHVWVDNMGMGGLGGGGLPGGAAGVAGGGLAAALGVGGAALIAGAVAGYFISLDPQVAAVRNSSQSIGGTASVARGGLGMANLLNVSGRPRGGGPLGSSMGGLSLEERDAIAAAVAEQSRNSMISDALGSFGEHGADRTGWKKVRGQFGSSVSGAITNFPALLKYLSGAQGSTGGPANAAFLATVQSQIGVLQHLLPNAKGGQKDTITAEIKTLEGIVSAKRFEITAPALLSVVQTVTASPDVREQNRINRVTGPKPPTQDDQRETNRLLRVMKDNPPKVNVYNAISVSTILYGLATTARIGQVGTSATKRFNF